LSDEKLYLGDDADVQTSAAKLVTVLVGTAGSDRPRRRLPYRAFMVTQHNVNLRALIFAIT